MSIRAPCPTMCNFGFRQRLIKSGVGCTATPSGLDLSFTMLFAETAKTIDPSTILVGPPVNLLRRDASIAHISACKDAK